jgi:hypothetical protein
MAFLVCLGHEKAWKTVVQDTRHTVDAIQIWYLKQKDKAATWFSEG